ncbi:MAG TPA: hypothetical protein VF506_15950, partial [Streptosporangiaceae bacterium]
MTDRAVATASTTIRPCWNGTAIRCGKNVRPVSACLLAAGSVAKVPVDARRWCTGFTPRTESRGRAYGGGNRSFAVMSCIYSCHATV